MTDLTTTGVGLGLRPIHPVLAPIDDVIKGAGWFHKVPDDIVLKPGSQTDKAIVVPQSQARKALRSVVRLVADLPASARPLVVWTDGDDELLVDISATTLTCLVGMVRIEVKVACDQLAEPTKVEVAFAVGSEDRPAGLSMSAHNRLLGPDVVVDRWSDAITAFAWEALIETATQLAARTGKDARGRPLIPGAISSGSGTLTIQPMARHELRG